MTQTPNDLMNVITTAIAHHPRSLQKRIGPSEIGSPCARRVAYKLAGIPAVSQSGGWLPTIGTAVHAWLADAYEAENQRLARQRFLVEERVSIKLTDGSTLSGSLDLFDVDTGRVVDHKVVGKTTLDKARRGHVDEKYRIQLNVYGLALWLEMRDVKEVVINFLPRNGQLDEAHQHVEPFDAELAAAAIARMLDLKTTLRILGPDALQSIPQADDRCRLCPWFSYGSTDAQTACGGAPEYADSIASVGGLIKTLY